MYAVFDVPLLADDCRGRSSSLFRDYADRDLDSQCDTGCPDDGDLWLRDPGGC